MLNVLLVHAQPVPQRSKAGAVVSAAAPAAQIQAKPVALPAPSGGLPKHRTRLGFQGIFASWELTQQRRQAKRQTVHGNAAAMQCSRRLVRANTSLSRAPRLC